MLTWVDGYGGDQAWEEENSGLRIAKNCYERECGPEADVGLQ